nr:Tn3 family transposase [Paenactinomyces guangxiensis]
MRARGMEIPEEYLQYLSPLGWEHITFNGDYVWNLKQRIDINNPRAAPGKNRVDEKCHRQTVKGIPEIFIFPTYTG